MSAFAETKEPPGQFPSSGEKAKPAIFLPENLSAKKNYGPLYSFPIGGWFSIFFLAPILIILVFSFLRRGVYGGVEWEFSLAAYQSLATPGVLRIALRTLIISLVATTITILVALPCGYYMARSKYQTVLLLLIIIPFWTNFLVRVFAWMNILGNAGFVNELLLRLNIINTHLPLMHNQGAVTLVLIYMYLPYAILPLFATIDKFDFSLLEAAQDLGASKFTSIVTVLLPNIKGGILTAVLFTFIPTFGAYAVPQLVGGMHSYMLGNIIADQLLRARNWPFASAITIILTTISTVGVIVMIIMQQRESLRLKAGNTRLIDAGLAASPEAAI
ncbi:MAG: ABC transporter permease [Treponema sp.]|nr:ABC transporter permease [Treponema sp.]